ncbi:DUF6069 family protein [Microbacterium sp. BK668]|uniref:DUF6069 family protein n=1 Tax=Microbacterium sp. BK668 TaxID=2512118 RepID=UPI00105F9197|nr:DUF6069 family protein [Microbacterium sp. BK668]TDN90756.1 hypothetical protein EV279_0244 [Microbacterium sp. BK668]
MTRSTPATRTSVPWTRALVAVGIATVLNVAIAAVAAAVLDAGEFVALQPGPVATVTVGTMLAGTLFFAVLIRVTAHAAPWFTVIALGVALVSLVAPVALAVDSSGSFPGSSPAAALALIPLHLIPAVTLVAALTRTPEEARS